MMARSRFRPARLRPADPIITFQEPIISFSASTHNFGLPLRLTEAPDYNSHFESNFNMRLPTEPNGLGAPTTKLRAMIFDSPENGRSPTGFTEAFDGENLSPGVRVTYRPFPRPPIRRRFDQRWQSESFMGAPPSREPYQSTTMRITNGFNRRPGKPSELVKSPHTVQDVVNLGYALDRPFQPPQSRRPSALSATGPPEEYLPNFPPPRFAMSNMFDPPPFYSPPENNYRTPQPDTRNNPQRLFNGPKSPRRPWQDSYDAPPEQYSERQISNPNQFEQDVPFQYDTYQLRTDFQNRFDQRNKWNREPPVFSDPNNAYRNREFSNDGEVVTVPQITPNPAQENANKDLLRTSTPRGNHDFGNLDYPISAQQRDGGRNKPMGRTRESSAKNSLINAQNEQPPFFKPTGSKRSKKTKKRYLLEPALPTSDFNRRFPMRDLNQQPYSTRSKEQDIKEVTAKVEYEPGYGPVFSLRRSLFETSKISGSSHGKDETSGATVDNTGTTDKVSEPGYGPPTLSAG